MRRESTNRRRSAIVVVMTDTPDPQDAFEAPREHPLSIALANAAEYPIESETDFDTINEAMLTAVNVGERLMARGLELAEAMRLGR